MQSASISLFTTKNGGFKQLLSMFNSFRGPFPDTCYTFCLQSSGQSVQNGLKNFESLMYCIVHTGLLNSLFRLEREPSI